MATQEIDRLLALIDQAFDKKSWHGTNLRGSLRGVAPRRGFLAAGSDGS